ncbi:MAG: MerR family transcriptional regulator [Ruminococcaceae bacterium]|nr:MerR family transcriptional regulator [Oscillospiraceae bacterium]
MTTMEIGEVCKLLGVTSRTLRYYEDRGIIQSTAVSSSRCRHYTAEQIEHIKKVLVLRSLGVSIASISRLKEGNTNLSEIIAEHKAKLIALLDTKIKELRLLDEALTRLDAGESIFLQKRISEPEQPQVRLEIAETGTEAIIKGNLEPCYEHFTPALKSALPLPSFRKALADTIAPIGKFLCFDRNEWHQNSVLIYLKHEKLGLVVQFSFDVNDKIQGIWFRYYEY